MKINTKYTWEEDDIVAGHLAAGQSGATDMIGYIMGGKKNEYVFIDARDGCVMRSEKWNTKKKMAAYLTEGLCSPVKREDDIRAGLKKALKALNSAYGKTPEDGHVNLEEFRDKVVQLLEGV